MHLCLKDQSIEISPERLSRFFVVEQGSYRVSKSLREMVVFAKQNLFVDPPFSRMDLISCRNLLIYLGPSLQSKTIPNAVGLLSLQKGSENLIQQQARNIIERQMKHMQRLVDDLLEVSRITTGRVQLRRERVVVSRIVECAVETARPLIEERRHELTVSIPPEPIWLNADVSRMEQVLVNLLTNAAKYTSEGGRIWVTVQQEGDECVLRVRDNGVGIPRELLPRIFDLFTQAERSLDRSQGGLGIGLALVQRLTNLHGGTVEAESELGKGSEFLVRLPVLLTDIVLVALTGYGQETDRQIALQAGFNHHLVKPARLEQLQKILSTVKKLHACE